MKNVVLYFTDDQLMMDQNTVGPTSNDISLSDTLSIASDILWYPS